LQISDKGGYAEKFNFAHTFFQNGRLSASNFALLKENLIFRQEQNFSIGENLRGGIALCPSATTPLMAGDAP